MRGKILGMLLAILVLLSGCSSLTKEEILNKTEKNLENIKTYQCTVKVEVTGNKGSQLYEMKQYYQYPDLYRLETLSPKHLTGKVTIINGERAQIYHPHIEKSIIIDPFIPNREEDMFLGNFLKWNFQEHDIIEEKVRQEEAYLVLTRKLQEENYYHHKQSIWIHKKDGMPKYMVVYDRDGNKRIELSIHDFVGNPDLNNKLFIIDEKN